MERLKQFEVQCNAGFTCRSFPAASQSPPSFFCHRLIKGTPPPIKLKSKLLIGSSSNFTHMKIVSLRHIIAVSSPYYNFSERDGELVTPPTLLCGRDQYFSMKNGLN